MANKASESDLSSSETFHKTPAQPGKRITPAQTYPGLRQASQTPSKAEIKDRLNTYEVHGREPTANEFKLSKICNEGSEELWRRPRVGDMDIFRNGF